MVRNRNVNRTERAEHPPLQVRRPKHMHVVVCGEMHGPVDFDSDGEIWQPDVHGEAADCCFAGGDVAHAVKHA
jgi:hypothetical protein